MTSHTTISVSDTGNSQTMSPDDISRSIASAASQAVQRAVNQALSRLPFTPTSATSSSSATSISTTSSTFDFDFSRVMLMYSLVTHDHVAFLWRLVWF